MCENCGCMSNEPVKKIRTTESHMHTHPHSHAHGHYHEHEQHGNGHYHSHEEDEISMTEVHKQNLLQAERNRAMFEAKNILALKIAGSQGSGKTMVIEKAVEQLIDTCNLFVIEDNRKTTPESDRISAIGAKMINVNDGDGCRLDAEKVFKAVKSVELIDKSVLFIENLADAISTGGLTDLGEIRSVVVFGVAEGDNKPAKYPDLFSGADVCLINKIDLMPYVDFDIGKVKKTILTLNPTIKFFEISARTGEGIAQWISWITGEYSRISE